MQYTARRSEPTKAASLSQIEKNSTLTSSLASLKLGSSAQDVNATAESRATSSATVRASEYALELLLVDFFSLSGNVYFLLDALVFRDFAIRGDISQ